MHLQAQRPNVVTNSARQGKGGAFCGKRSEGEPRGAVIGRGEYPDKAHGRGSRGFRAAAPVDGPSGIGPGDNEPASPGYSRVDYPDKTASQDVEDGQPMAFLRIGGDDSVSEWNFTLPTRITNNTMDLLSGEAGGGSTGSFIDFQGTNVIELMEVRNNTVMTYVDTGETLYFFNSTLDSGSRNLCNSVIDLDTNVLINEGPGTARMFDPDIVLGSIASGGPLRVGSNRWVVRLNDDSVGSIPHFARAAESVVVSLTGSHSNSVGHFSLAANSATITSFGLVGSALEASATGASLTGTAGTDGKTTLGLHSDGTLYIENRTGLTRRYNIARVA